MRSLRSRLLLSHILPPLLIMSLIGVVLTFVLESQVILVNLSRQLLDEARLVANVARDHPEIWTDSAQAQVFVDRFNPELTAQLKLLQLDGRMLASGEPSDAPLLGQIVDHPALVDVRSGETSVAVNYSRDLQDEVADAVIPVFDRNGEVVGIVQLTRELASVLQRFQQLRVYTAWVLIPGLLLGLLVGLILAITLERPLHQLTSAINDASGADGEVFLPEQGPQEVRHVAHAFNTLLARLGAIEAARRELLANLAHELARPLSALHAAIHALQSGAIADPMFGAYLLTGMEAELQGLQRILKDLLQFYELTLGTVQLSRRPTEVGEWLSTCLSTWQQAAERKGLAWHATIPDALPTVFMDPERMSQVLGNLLSNAIKYTPAGGTVRVEAEAGERELRIGVSDTGPGIDPQEFAHIFEPFYRMNAGRSSAHGLGLGLTIVRDLARAHGGKIEVESEPGHGSHFTLRLPLNVHATP